MGPAGKREETGRDAAAGPLPTVRLLHNPRLTGGPGRPSVARSRRAHQSGIDDIIAARIAARFSTAHGPAAIRWPVEIVGASWTRRHDPVGFSSPRARFLAAASVPGGSR